MPARPTLPATARPNAAPRSRRRRGLSSACIEGMCATAAPIAAVIDGDLQHDETILPAMLEALQADATLDVVIGSRFVDGGGTGDWDSDRVAKSAFATKLSRKV